MKNSFQASWKKSRRALSLIEVVVGLALMGGLLVTVVMAASRIAKQNRAIAQRREAIDALEALLSGLETRSVGLQGSTSGTVRGYEHLEWRATSVPNSRNAVFMTRQVEIEIIDRKTQKQLTSVELVVPDPPTTPGRN